MNITPFIQLYFTIALCLWTLLFIPLLAAHVRGAIMYLSGWWNNKSNHYEDRELNLWYDKVLYVFVSIGKHLGAHNQQRNKDRLFEIVVYSLVYVLVTWIVSLLWCMGIFLIVREIKNIILRHKGIPLECDLVRLLAQYGNGSIAGTKSSQWSDLLVEHPEYIEFCPFNKINSGHIFHILKEQPQLFSHFREADYAWAAIDYQAISRLLIRDSAWFDKLNTIEECKKKIDKISAYEWSNIVIENIDLLEVSPVHLYSEYEWDNIIDNMDPNGFGSQVARAKEIRQNCLMLGAVKPQVADTTQSNCRLGTTPPTSTLCPPTT